MSLSANNITLEPTITVVPSSYNPIKADPAALLISIEEVAVKYILLLAVRLISEFAKRFTFVEAFNPIVPTPITASKGTAAFNKIFSDVYTDMVEAVIEERCSPGASIASQGSGSLKVAIVFVPVAKTRGVSKT